MNVFVELTPEEVQVASFALGYYVGTVASQEGVNAAGTLLQKLEAVTA